MVFAFVERVFCGFNVEEKVVVIEEFQDCGFFGSGGESCGMFNLNFIRKNFFVDEVHGDGGCVSMEFVLLFDESCSCCIVDFGLDATRKEGSWESFVSVGGDHRFGEDVLDSFRNNEPVNHAGEARAFFFVGGDLSVVIWCNFDFRFKRDGWGVIHIIFITVGFGVEVRLIVGVNNLLNASK